MAKTSAKKITGQPFDESAKHQESDLEFNAIAASGLSKSASHSARVRDRTLYNQYRLTRQIPPEQKPYQ